MAANPSISPAFPFTMHSAPVLNSQISYIDTGSPPNLKTTSPTILFLHGNPTSSYLWRNIIPHLSPHTRCIAPDLIGMGKSGKPSDISYSFTDHARYLDAFLSAVLPKDPLILVIHDWGSALGLDWARQHPDRIRGIAMMEYIHPHITWASLPELGAAAFREFRNPEVGRKLIIEDNAFIEQLLPGSVVRKLSEEEMDHYRAPFTDPASREPVYRWPNMVPIDGEPQDMHELAKKYDAWLLQANRPVLVLAATPGAIVSEELAAEYEGALKNGKVVNIGAGLHYLQEDHPHAIGREIETWLLDFM